MLSGGGKEPGVSGTPSEEFPGWEDDGFGNLMLSVTIPGREIRLATVTHDPDTGLYETFIGLRLVENRLGRIDGSQSRAVAKAEDFLIGKVSKLL